jgi:hypothetical protein
MFSKKNSEILTIGKSPSKNSIIYSVSRPSRGDTLEKSTENLLD